MTNGWAALVGIVLVIAAVAGLINLATPYGGWIFGGILTLCVVGFFINGLREYLRDMNQRQEFKRRRRQALLDLDDDYRRKSEQIRSELPPDEAAER